MNCAPAAVVGVAEKKKKPPQGKNGANVKGSKKMSASDQAAGNGEAARVKAMG